MLRALSTPRIGIAIGAETIRIVYARSGRVTWASEGEITPAEENVGSRLAEMLVELPLSRRERRRARLLVAFGPHAVQVRRLDGLPEVDDVGLLATVVRENPRRWFLAPPGTLITSEVAKFADGEFWGAAFDAELMRETISACMEAGLRVEAAVPTACVLDAAIVDERIVWADGERIVAVKLTGGALHSVDRQPRGSAADREHRLSVAAGSMGAHAPRFVDALGAAFSERSSIPARLPYRDLGGDGNAVSPARARAAIATLVCTVGLALLAYPAGAYASRSRASRQLERVAVQERAAVRLSLQLAAVTESITAVVDRRASLRSTIDLMAKVADALPPNGALVTMRLDTIQGVVVLLGPRAGTLVDRLEEVPDAVWPELVGPVTSETVNGRGVERATVKFKRPVLERSPAARLP